MTQNFTNGLKDLINQSELSKRNIALGSNISITTMHNICYAERPDCRASTMEKVFCYIAANDPSILDYIENPSFPFKLPDRP